MPNRICIICGTSWDAHDRSKTCSLDCRKKWNAQKAAVRRAAKWQPPKPRFGTCSGCGQDFRAAQKGVIPKKCPSCNHTHAPSEPRIGICELCGEEFTWGRPGKLPRACPTHHAERMRLASRESQRRRYAWVPVVRLAHCQYEDCCNFFAVTKDNRSQKWCEWCKVLRDRDVQRMNRPKRIKNARFRRFGITEQQYEQMLVAQRGRCAACGTTEPGGGYNNWHIDHDHRCCPSGGSCGGCVRGLLCNNCNLSAGLSGDEPSRLRQLADYLERTRQLRLAV